MFTVKRIAKPQFQFHSSGQHIGSPSSYFSASDEDMASESEYQPLYPESESQSLESESQSLEHDELQSEFMPNQESVRKTRGPAKLLKTWGGDPMKVEINELNQAVGIYSKKLKSQMGRTVKIGNFFPLNKLDWRLIDVHAKNRTWIEYKACFALEERYKATFLRNLGKLWKNWKCTVKRKYYTPYKEDGERLAICPDDIEDDQWPDLVQYWSSEEGNKTSTVGSANRSKLKVAHRTGRKGFAVVRDEIVKEEGEPDEFEFWMTTHYGLAKSDLDRKTFKFIEKLTRMANTDPEALQSKEKALAKLLGPEKPRQMRTYGFGPTPKQLNVVKEQKKFVEDQVSHVTNAIREGLKEELMSEFRVVIEEIVREVVHSLIETTNFTKTQDPKCFTSQVDITEKSGFVAKKPQQPVHVENSKKKPPSSTGTHGFVPQVDITEKSGFAAKKPQKQPVHVENSKKKPPSDTGTHGFVLQVQITEKTQTGNGCVEKKKTVCGTSTRGVIPQVPVTGKTQTGNGCVEKKKTVCGTSTRGVIPQVYRSCIAIWMFTSCHAWGLATTFEVGNGLTASTTLPPPPWDFPKCFF